MDSYKISAKIALVALSLAAVTACREEPVDPPKTDADLINLGIPSLPEPPLPVDDGTPIGNPVLPPIPAEPEPESKPEPDPLPPIVSDGLDAPSAAPTVPDILLAPKKAPAVSPEPPGLVDAPEPGQEKTEPLPWYSVVHINPTIAPKNAPIRESDYERRWRTMVIRSSWQSKVDWSANKIVDNGKRYVDVQNDVKVPWYVIAVIHNMECSLRFDRHLHNGNPLTKRTYWVPAGRPKTGSPPFTWEYSAKDALRYDKLDKVEDWGLHHMLYTIERYNGLGYLRYHKDVPTPYLWSGSQHYVKGKYVSDGKWSSTAVSQQTGAAVILKELSNRGLLPF